MRYALKQEEDKAMFTKITSLIDRDEFLLIKMFSCLYLRNNVDDPLLTDIQWQVLTTLEVLIDKKPADMLIFTEGTHFDLLGCF